MKISPSRPPVPPPKKKEQQTTVLSGFTQMLMLLCFLEYGLQIHLLNLMHWHLHLLLNAKFKPLFFQLYVYPPKQNS